VAINQVVKNIYDLTNKITISAVQSNAGAGGVYLALANDYCFVK
jgi:enoyl-CoA hydratase/carnithine racemase